MIYIIFQIRIYYFIFAPNFEKGLVTLLYRKYI